MRATGHFTEFIQKNSGMAIHPEGFRSEANR